MMLQPIQIVDKGKVERLEQRQILLRTENTSKSVQFVLYGRRRRSHCSSWDSDSDLEIVTSHSQTRKYALFEKMPSRKAHETESHLLLRNLAHLGGEGRDKSGLR